MPAILKSFMGIFFFALVLFTGIGILNFQADVSRAKNYQRDVLKELQDSDFAPSVLNACLKDGASRNYSVRIDVSSSDGGRRIYTDGCPAFDTADVAAAYVTVEYKSRLPFLGVEMAGSLRGFAR